MEQEKSAIDVIYEMHEAIVNLKSDIELLKKSNAMLVDLIAKQHVTHHTEPAKGQHVVIETSKPKEVTVELPIEPPVKIASSAPVIVQAGPENKSQSIRAFGILKDSSGKALHGLPVAIVDAKVNNVVKTTKTNMAGEFTSFLPPGKYVAVVTLEDNRQKFKPFNINLGMKEVEVSIV